MVKFSKELEAQLIPEWKDAFVTYRQLKKHIKKIKLSRKHHQNQNLHPPHNYHSFPFSIFNSLRLFTKRFFARWAGNNDLPEIVQENKSRTADDAEENDNENELYQLFSEEDEAHGTTRQKMQMRMFFNILDEELPKVNEFYTSREREFIEREEILTNQLQILLELKQILTDRRHKNSPFKSSGQSLSTSSMSSSRRDSDFSESTEELSAATTPTNETSETDDVITALNKNDLSFVGTATRSSLKSNGKQNMAMRVDIPATTPTRMIATLISLLWEDLVNNPRWDGPADFINRKKVQYAEKMIRSAFVELYRGLSLLKTYRSLNMTAFTKILKKFDKVANQQVSANYLKEVKRSNFISSDKAVKLMDEVESLFTKNFANDDRKKAMKFLKPEQNKESHMITFFIGLFTGTFVTLFNIYAVLAHVSSIFSPSADTRYLEFVYPIFSVFALISLHLFLYGCNLFMWKTIRINYNFIFDFSPSTSLKYKDAFLMCTTLMTAVVGAMIIQLLLRAKGFSSSQVDVIPGTLLIIFIVLLICPLDILYRPTRYCFLRVMRNIVFSPFYKVYFVDVFMGDQLTSQIPLMRYMESTICYFIARTLRTHHYESCRSGRIYTELIYLISFLPYFWRALQCGRRWFDECDINNLANMGKYLSAIVAAVVRVTYGRQDNHFWFAMALITSVVATVYQLYWDFVKDWGFFNSKSKNLWLRDELLLSNRGIYYFSIALNVVLRVAWVETVMKFRIGVESNLLEFLVASLEVIRRCQWNFYRLENEHLNNIRKYRAVKTVPLPFREIE